MSNMTDAVNQPNMYCGFYPSTNGDRKYGSSDFGRFLNGLICDGVFLTLHDQFKVSPTANPGRSVIVGTGKAWFNGTWLELTDEYGVECDEAYQDGDRYDAIVIAINTTPGDFIYDGKLIPAYDTTIISVKGPKSAAGNPVVPIKAGEQEVSEGVFLYPIADIYRARLTNTITTSDIRIRVGEAVCPYVEALVTPSNDATEFTEMWRAQLDEFIDSLESDWAAEKERYNNDWNVYFYAKQDETNGWMQDMENSIIVWFNSIQGNLGDDPATNLQMQINADEVERFLVSGLPNGTTTISADGSTIKTVDSENGWILTTTFTDNFSTITTTLTTSRGEVGRLVKNISADGSTITSTLTNNSNSIPSLVEIEQKVDELLAVQEEYISK